MHACSVTKSCLTLCYPMDCSLPGSSVRGLLQARLLGWVAIYSSRGSSWPRQVDFLCHWATKKGYPTVYIHLIWQPTAIFLPGKFRGQRSLVGDSPWSHKESTRLSDFTKDLLAVITMGTGILKMNTWSQNSIYSFSPDLGEPLHQHRTAGFLIKAIVGGEGWGQICTKSLTSSLRIAISGQLN